MGRLEYVNARPRTKVRCCPLPVLQSVLPWSMPTAVNVKRELCRSKSVLLCFSVRVKSAQSLHSKQKLVLYAVDRHVLPPRVVASPPNEVERFVARVLEARGVQRQRT
jgi:hypothetical protein